MDAEDTRIKRLEERLAALESKVRKVEKDKREVEEELWRLRDKVEEEVWARQRVEDKLKNCEEMKAEVLGAMKEGMKEEIEAVKQETKKAVMEAVKEETKKAVMEVVKGASVEKESGAGGGQDMEEKKYKCIVLTDSKGRGATTESVREHMPREERQKYDIQIVVAYRLEEAFSRICRGEFDVKDSYVVIDNITNSVRSSWRSQSESPEQVVRRVAVLRDLILSSSAVAVVVCQIKPLASMDVRPYNHLLSAYLGSCGQTGFGCNTQVHMDYLASDGYHVNPRYGSVIDRTYACALLGTAAPCPTDDDFLPVFLRHRMDNEWPRLAGGRGVGTINS